MLDISYYITDIFDEFNSFGCCFKKNMFTNLLFMLFLILEVMKKLLVFLLGNF